MSTMMESIQKLERKLRKLTRNKGQTKLLLVFFVLCYLIVGLILYVSIVYKIRWHDIRSAFSLSGEGPSSFSDDVIQELLNDGFPPEVIQGMMEQGIRPVKIKMVVKRSSTSFRGGNGGSIEDLFGHDPFLAALMGDAMQHIESGPSWHQHGADHHADEDGDPTDGALQQKNPIAAVMQQKMQHEMMLKQMMAQGDMPPQVAAALAAGVPPENIRVRRRINVQLNDGHGHRIRIQINSPQEALDGFFPRMSAEKLLQSGAFDDVINSIIKDVNEREAATLTNAENAIAGNGAEELEPSSDAAESSPPEKIKPQKRILVMAAEIPSNFAALEENMRQSFAGQGYDGVDVRNYVTPLDFINSEDFRQDGYHDIRDLGVLPSIMHEVADEKPDDESHTKVLLERFCQKVENLLVKEKDCEFSCVNQIEPKLLEKTIDQVEACHTILGKLKKKEENKGKYIKTSWTREEL